MSLKESDDHIEVFMGTTFTFENIETVGDLRAAFEQILRSLPEDDTLEIAEIHGKRHELSYLLKEGIPQ